MSRVYKKNSDYFTFWGGKTPEETLDLFCGGLYAVGVPLWIAPSETGRNEPQE
ncbi:MAG: hypothetical protein LBJ67_16525 [Planctomycetaceae bacterium]|jgi:hypothetical protein|nr:hypothetical protein [Planctomycetaceae bacterium]